MVFAMLSLTMFFFPLSLSAAKANRLQLAKKFYRHEKMRQFFPHGVSQKTFNIFLKPIFSIEKCNFLVLFFAGGWPSGNGMKAENFPFDVT